MNEKKDPAEQAGGPPLIITRIFDAPPELVWKAWTEPGRMKLWWGPKGYTLPVCKIDLRVGGAYLYCMRSPEGRDFWGTGVYRELDPPRRLVATDSFADEKGRIVPASHYGMDSKMPLEMLLTLTLEDAGGKTKLILEHAGMPPGNEQEGAREGWSQSFDKLAEILKS